MVLVLGLCTLQAAVQEPDLGEMGLGKPQRGGRKGLKAGVDLRRDGGRGNCLLLGDNEVLINVFGSRLQVWDESQDNVSREISEAGDRSETS